MSDSQDNGEFPVAWTAIPQNLDVLASGGEKVGTVSEVLGTGNVGIFHGLAVHTHFLQHPVMVPAADVDEITNKKVTLKLDTASFSELEMYVPEAVFTLGIKGLFRHRPGWTGDHNQNE